MHYSALQFLGVQCSWILCTGKKLDEMVLAMSYPPSPPSATWRNWISDRPCNHQLFINATKKSINSRIVSIANWILHQSTSTHPLGRQTFVEKTLWRILKKARSGQPTTWLISPVSNFSCLYQQGCDVHSKFHFDVMYAETVATKSQTRYAHSCIYLHIYV